MRAFCILSLAWPAAAEVEITSMLQVQKLHKQNESASTGLDCDSCPDGYFDGCNYCRCAQQTGPGACTRRGCAEDQKQKPYCMDPGEKECPPLCRIHCPFGNVVEDGCPICKCRDKPCPTTKPPQCFGGAEAPFLGEEEDEDGCKILKYGECPPPCPIVDPIQHCPNGQRPEYLGTTVTEHGCKIPQYKCPHLCPIVDPMPCKEGYISRVVETRVDENGCKWPKFTCEKQCGPLCMMHCPFGNVVKDGCPICKCREKPCAMTAPPQCIGGGEAPLLGEREDENGCKIQKYGDCPPPCPHVDPIQHCPNGKRPEHVGTMVNENGCKIPQYKCPEDKQCGPLCRMHCPFGNVVEDGCPICKCREKPCAMTAPPRCVGGGEAPLLGEEEDADGCKIPKYGECPVPCPHGDPPRCKGNMRPIITGTTVNKNGCKLPQFKCPCPAVAVPMCPGGRHAEIVDTAVDEDGCKIPEYKCPHLCPIVDPMPCKEGYISKVVETRVDENGCKWPKFTCEKQCGPICRMHCPMGFVEKDGCPICQCKKPCPIVDPPRCRPGHILKEIDGRVDENGCKIPKFKCEKQCGPICRMHCPLGFVEKDGCPICECKKPDVACDGIEDKKPNRCKRFKLTAKKCAKKNRLKNCAASCCLLGVVG